MITCDIIVIVIISLATHMHEICFQQYTNVVAYSIAIDIQSIARDDAINLLVQLLWHLIIFWTENLSPVMHINIK